MLKLQHCYIIIAGLGMKGDTGEPGVRGPRGLVGEMHMHCIIIVYN